MKNRREFIKKSVLGTAAISIFPTQIFSKPIGLKQLTILHTNDMHTPETTEFSTIEIAGKLHTQFQTKAIVL